MTRNDLIEHAAYIITEAPELKNAREALYKFYREHYNLYRAETKLSVLLITCLQRYYYYIDIHVSRDDIEYHLWAMKNCSNSMRCYLNPTRPNARPHRTGTNHPRNSS